MQPSPSSTLSNERQPLLKKDNATITVEESYDSDTSSETIDTIEEIKAGNYDLSMIVSEVGILTKSSVPLVFAYLLQYSLTIVVTAVVGHLSPLDLAAASLGIMTSNMTGIGVYEGLAAGLDTLCAQAYGAGRPDMIGVHVQRMIHLMALVTIPISLLWATSSHWLGYIIEDPDLVATAARVMMLLILGNPGYFLFEAGRRFVQAQGLFRAPLYVMLAALPTQLFFIWLLVVHLGWGLTGAILSLSITRTLFPIYLVIYVLLVEPSSLQCWGGFEKFAPRTWHRMIRLAIPGMCIVGAEEFLFQFMTIAGTYLSVSEAAAQSVMTTLAVVVAHVPLAISIATATRLGHLIGAEELYATKMVMMIAIAVSLIVGTADGILMMAFKEPIIAMFTSDASVADVARKVMPVLAFFQIFEHSTAVINGILRGVGKQGRGAWITFGLFIFIGVPAGLGFAFGSWHMRLSGIWLGAIIAYFIITIVAGIYSLTSDLRKVVAKIRDTE